MRTYNPGNPNIGAVNRKAPGVSSLSAIRDSYIQNCKKHNREFSITTEEFEKLITANCHYCGSAPVPRKVKKSIPDLYAAHGIDRVNNEIGYILSNCVTCCKTCNRAKNNLTYTEFQSWLKQVARYNADL